MFAGRFAVPSAHHALGTLLALGAMAGALPGSPAAAARREATTVSGTVFDSLSDAPLVGALVQLVGTRNDGRVWSARTDARGTFEMHDVPSGRYLIGFWHPALDSMGIEIAPRAMTVDDELSLRVALAIPTPFAIRAQLCPHTQPADSTGLLLGFVRDIDTGAHLTNARVILSWTELVMDKQGMRTQEKRAQVRAGDAGWYAVCGVPAAGPVAVHAEAGSVASGDINLDVPSRGLLHQDFAVPTAPDVAAHEAHRRGTAALTGVVRDESGRPLVDAQLILWGTSVTASTRSDGTFSMAGLPSGTRTLEVRYVGYAPGVAVVDLAAGRTRTVTVRLSHHATVLGSVTVAGRRTRAEERMAGFLQRRSLGFGHFMTRTEIARRKPIRFTDVLRSVPSLDIAPTGGNRTTILSKHGSALGGACRPDIYLDGTRLVGDVDLDAMVRPEDITGVEIYSGISETPAQFQGSGMCGAIVIWVGPRVAARNP